VLGWKEGVRGSVGEGVPVPQGLVLRRGEPEARRGSKSLGGRGGRRGFRAGGSREK